MKKLLNTLYVTSENSYLGLDGENIVVYDEQKEVGRLPLESFRLGIEEQAPRLWEHARKEIFRFVI